MFGACPRPKCGRGRVLRCSRLIRASIHGAAECSFVIRYPPGFPVLVPGQLINKEIIECVAGQAAHNDGNGGNTRWTGTSEA